jgi:hypothetical protein
MNPKDFELTQASHIYGIANTPPFLVRKLQADTAVRAIGEDCPTDKILEELRASVVSEPESPMDAVRPYALLVALWFKPGIEHLKEAAQIQAPAYRWFSDIAELLIQTFSPVQRRTIIVPGQLSARTVSLGSPASTIIISGN